MQNENLRLEGVKIYLRPVKVSDATEEYVNWLNDPEVNQFLEIRFVQHGLEGLKDDIRKILADPKTIFLAIIQKDNNKHIGNIKLGPIDPQHKVGSIGIMIGDKSSWGKGFATEAVRLLTDYAFGMLTLHKVTAGAYENNLGSIKAFLKLGFFEEGRLKEHVLFDGDYIDKVLVAKLNINNYAA